MANPNNNIEHLTDVAPDEFDVRLDDETLSSSHISAGETGLTPMHRQNIDESRIDELLVEDNLDDNDYPDIVDIADKDAAKTSHDNDF